MDTQTELTGRNAILGFLRAPLEARTYGNLIDLLLAFPLGLFYFLFLVIGLSVGFGLTLIWIGIPLLLLVLLGSRAFSAFERQLAIGLLGAEVPPMSPPHPASPRTIGRQLGDILGNPVTWKGIGFLLVKLPLGVVTFGFSIFLVALSISLLLTPFFYTLLPDPPEVFFGWYADTLGRALLCSALGLVLTWVSLNLLNDVAWLWKILASAALGNASFSTPRSPEPPALPAAPALA
jgi:hypothetical protein